MTFMTPHLTEGEIFASKLLTYFSLSSEEQIKLAWNPGPIFCKEGPENKGANFLLGMVHVFREHTRMVYDQVDSDTGDRLEGIYSDFNDASIECSNPPWSFDALREDPFWEKIRAELRIILNKMRLKPALLDETVDFKDFIEIDRYKFD